MSLLSRYRGKKSIWDSSTRNKDISTALTFPARLCERGAINNFTSALSLNGQLLFRETVTTRSKAA